VIGVAPYIDKPILHTLCKFKSYNVVIIRNCCDSFASFTNNTFQRYGKTSKWFIVAHDDIDLKTQNFIPTLEKTVKPMRDIGWVSFTDDDYLNGNWAPSTRPGYHRDFLEGNAWSKRQMFQFHLLGEGWLKRGSYRGLNYDFPEKPVICHAPFSHFIAIESSKFDLCEDWSEVSLLVDEDWGLSAMRKGLWNIWIPNIVYTHCRIAGTRAAHIISKKAGKVHNCFRQKWGFTHHLPKRKDLKTVKRMYGNTNIVWSFDRDSFDWEYI